MTNFIQMTKKAMMDIGDTVCRTKRVYMLDYEYTAKRTVLNPADPYTISSEIVSSWIINFTDDYTLKWDCMDGFSLLKNNVLLKRTTEKFSLIDFLDYGNPEDQI